MKMLRISFMNSQIYIFNAIWFRMHTEAYVRRRKLTWFPQNALQCVSKKAETERVEEWIQHLLRLLSVSARSSENDKNL